jgi:signal transduction histidine kinase
MKGKLPPRCVNPMIATLFTLLFLCTSALAQAASPAPIELTAQFSERKIGRDIAILEDAEARLGLEQVRSPEVAARFVPSEELNPGFGYSKHAYWAHFTLKDVRAAQSTAAQPLFLTLGYASTDLAELWCADASGHIVLKQRAGDHVPRAEWPSNFREPTYKLYPNAHSCWLRVQSSSSLQLPLTLYSQDAFVKMRLSDNALQAMYFGALLVMLVYNGVLALSTRSLAYTTYVLFLLSYGLFQCAYLGFGYALLWPDAIGWADTVFPLLIACIGISSSVFTFLLLNIRHTAPFWFKFGAICIGMMSVHLLVSWVLPSSVATQLIYPLVVCWGVFLLGSGISLAAKGVRVAKIYLAAWIVFISGTLILMVSRVGWLPINALTENMQQIGSAIEFIILSFALADRLKTTQAALLDAQTKYTDTLRASGQQLDQKVKERTAELHERTIELQTAHQRISNALKDAESAQQHAENQQREAERARLQTAKAMEELQATQSQLIASEKMASLGLLVSNVAHEINNPIGAVQSSGVMVAEAMDATLHNLPRLLDAISSEHRALFVQLTTQTRGTDPLLGTREERLLTKQVSAFLENAGIDGAVRKARLIVKLQAQSKVADYIPLLKSPDSDFILNVANGIADVLNGTSNINAAAARIARIVVSLKELSGNDRSIALFDNHVYQGIEKAIAAMEPLLQDVDMVRNYQDVAPLRCDQDALKQVWMHLIHNALHASGHQGVIMIGLRMHDNQLEVRVADFGCGMTPDIKLRAFEPFFTTRSSGEGGGMGLTIARKIIEQHHGQIEVHTEAGVGTTVTVTLPYTRKDVLP